MDANNPIQIGVTGGIGTGKSVVCRLFQIMGAAVYDADSQAKMLMNTNATVIAAVTELFGEEAYQDQQLNRAHIAAKAFHDQDLLSQLNVIVHPQVAIDYRQWLAEQKSVYVVKEAALMFESGSHSQLDKVVVVTAPESLRMHRVLMRDPQRTKVEVEAIMSKQMPEEEKKEKADFVISNNETQSLIQQVWKLHLRFSGLSPQ